MAGYAHAAGADDGGPLCVADRRRAADRPPERGAGLRRCVHASIGKHLRWVDCNVSGRETGRSLRWSKICTHMQCLCKQLRQHYPCCIPGKAAVSVAATPTSWDVDSKGPEAPELGYLGDRQLIHLADGTSSSGALSPLAVVRSCSITSPVECRCDE